MVGMIDLKNIGWTEGMAPGTAASGLFQPTMRQQPMLALSPAQGL